MKISLILNQDSVTTESAVANIRHKINSFLTLDLTII